MTIFEGHEGSSLKIEVYVPSTSDTLAARTWALADCNCATIERTTTVAAETAATQRRDDNMADGGTIMMFLSLALSVGWVSKKEETARRDGATLCAW